MKYSYNWLQSHIEEPLPTPEALKEKIIFGAFEVESLEAKGDDTIFDIKVLPDRASDCLSHYGMAREIAGLCKFTLKQRKYKLLPATDLDTKVDITSDLCRRYIAIKVDGVKVAPSPAWLVQALESVGQKSINNIVDATNYVLLDRGQPVHAYDSANIDGGIVVRLAKEGEKIITLSEEQKELRSDMLVVADYIGPLAIAGVKGGKNAQVKSAGSETNDSVGPRVSSPDTTESPVSSPATTSIILEIANFDPVSVRKTSRSLGLVTDASKRFENNLSTSVAFDAAQQVVALIQELAGGTVAGVYEHFPNKPIERTLLFTHTDIARLLGSTITAQHINEVFDRYRYQYSVEGDTYTLTVPFERPDLTGVHDIAEEIGRVVGYDMIPATPLPEVHSVAHVPEYLAIRAAKAWLVHDGYREVQTYTFRKKGEVYVARGPKDKSALRTNLSDALKESYELNQRNAPLLGQSEIKLFEVGTVFVGDKEVVHVTTVAGGVVQETTLDAYIAEHKIVTEHTTLDTTATDSTFAPWSVYPFIVRDVAVWVKDEQEEARLGEIVQSFATVHALREPVCFDRFTKEGMTSVAYRFVFQSMDHTLTDQEVEKSWSELVQQVTQAGLTIR